MSSSNTINTWETGQKSMDGINYPDNQKPTALRNREKMMALNISKAFRHMMENSNHSGSFLSGWTTQHSLLICQLTCQALLILTVASPQPRPRAPQLFSPLFTPFDPWSSTLTPPTTPPSRPTHPWKRPLFCSCWSRMFSSFSGLGMKPMSQPSFTRRPIHQSLLNFCIWATRKHRGIDITGDLRGKYRETYTETIVFQRLLNLI